MALKLHWELGEDRQTAALTLPANPPVTIKMNVVAVEEMMKILGNLRSAMLPEIPTALTPGQTVRAIKNPAWVTEPDAMIGDPILHVRDPRFGWLHYLIPRRHARKLGSLLQRQADAGSGLHPPTESIN